MIHIGRFKVAELAVYAYVTRLVKDDEEEDGWANEPEEASVVYVNNKVEIEKLVAENEVCMFKLFLICTPFY